MSGNKKLNKKHAIQLQDLKVLQLSIVVRSSSQAIPAVEEFHLYHGHSTYDNEKGIIAVKLGVEIDSEIDEKSPFDLKVEILGFFKVDKNNFNIDYLEDWAARNAPLVLYPYIREQVYSLTSRAGFNGMLLPLFEVPTFKFEAKS